jgi:mono/diheme cytochrome c family protein
MNDKAFATAILQVTRAISWLIPLFLVAFLFISMNFKHRVPPAPKEMAYCGVVSPVAQLVDEGQREQYETGKILFRNNCAACHNKNMKEDLTGPALAGTAERWADYPREDLVGWIRSSQSLIKAGHPKAVELWKTWKPNLMNNFDLTDEEIEAILSYIDLQ